MDFEKIGRVKWEYKVVELVEPKEKVDSSIQAQLNYLGCLGWELVNVVTSCKGTTKGYMKRVDLTD